MRDMAIFAFGICTIFGVVLYFLVNQKNGPDNPA